MAGAKKGRKTSLCPIPECGKVVDARGLNLHVMKAHPGYRAKDFFEQRREDIPRPQGNGHTPANPPGDLFPETENKPAGSQGPPPPPPPPNPPSGSANRHDGKKPPAQRFGIEDAALLVVTPRRFEANSTLVWQAQAVTEKEWGWQHTDNMGDWLDTFLWWAFQKFGIVLGGYVVLNRPERKEQDEVLEEVE